MSYAPDYTPTTSFADDESNQAAGRSTVRTAALDQEFADIEATTDALNTNLQRLQRDDGKLLDLLVEPYALSEQTRAMMAALGRTPRGGWTQNTSYAVGDLVQNAAIAYMCIAVHNSGPTFNSGFWMAISGDGSAATSAADAAASAVEASSASSAANSSASTANISAVNAALSAAAAAASQLGAQNAADSIAGLSPVNLSALMLDFLANNNASGARADLGAASTADLAVVTSKLNTYVTPEDAQFGAVGNGIADDTVALQAFYTYLAANGGIGLLGRRTYKITAQISLTSPARGFAVYGSGPESLIRLRAASAVSAFGFVNPVGIAHHGIRIDCGYSVTGFASHGMSFRNADRCTWRDVEVFDHRGTAILTFVDADDTYGDCHIINCKADGNGSGQNGFLHEGMLRSSIQQCTVRNLSTSGSPSVGLQLKNRCKHSWIDGGYAEGCKSGWALGGDGAGAGDGPYDCWIRGVIAKNCLDGGTASKTTNCHVDYYADQTSSPAPAGGQGYALNIGGNNASFNATLRIKGVQSGRTAIRVGSNSVAIYVPHADGYGTTFAVIESGVSALDLTVGKIVGAGNTTDLGSLITNSSGNTGHLIRWLRDLPGQTVDGSSLVRMPVAGQVQNWFNYSHSTPTLTTRINGVDRLSLTASVFSPLPDNTLSCGSASFRWTTVYAATGTINTSDEREKQDIDPITDDVLDAWADVEFVTFRWKHSAQEKGAAARVHFGLIAQRVHAAFVARGLDPFRFGVLCYDEWSDQWADELSDSGEPTGKKVLQAAAGNRFGVRYEQALVLEAALMRREINRLKAGAK